MASSNVKKSINLLNDIKLDTGPLHYRFLLKKNLYNLQFKFICVSSVARITNDDRLIAMHSKSDEITELSDFGPRKVEATTFFDLTRNFTKDVFYR